MAHKKTKEQIRTNMSRVCNKDTALENALCVELIQRGIKTFKKNDKSVYGKPDITFPARKIAVFCDGDFWHGYDWENARKEIKSNQEFWFAKIEKNMIRDLEVTVTLQQKGWNVLRFWGHEIKNELEHCVSVIVDELQTFPEKPYRTIDLCAGIGGIRRGFELTGQFVNVLSAEVDKYFGLPINIAYARFPEWYFCPKCRKFQTIQKWVSEYKKVTNNKVLERDEYMVEHMQCPKCKQDLVVARIVTVCENGHLNDFPWVKWVHTKAKKPICGTPSLKFKTGASGTEGLEGLSISCACGANATLRGAFDKDCFEKLDQEGETNIFRCEGNHPFKHIKTKCSSYSKTVQRGASSVYFPVVHSSLVILPYADKLNAKIEQSKAFEDCVTIISDEEPEDRVEIIKKRLSKWVDKIALEIGGVKPDIEKILTKKWLEPRKSEIDVTSIQYRIEEYYALKGAISSFSGATLGDFSREEMNIEEYQIPHVKSISLIDKVRVVNALIGFSRINPAMNREDVGFVSVKEQNTHWYPAYEVRGGRYFY